MITMTLTAYIICCATIIVGVVLLVTGVKITRRETTEQQEREIERAAATFVKRAMGRDPTRTHKFQHDFMNASINDVPLGNWRITVEPLP